MAKHQSHLLFLLFLFGQNVSLVFGIQPTKFDIKVKQIRTDLFYMRDFNTSNAINGILSHNWTENHECLMELNAIKIGLKNREEWAMRVIDSWGNFPSGLQNGNVFEPGSFSECFHIKRNETLYKTQYCVGHLVTLYPNIQNFRIRITNYEPSISLGICLPANCKIHHLETIVNDVIQSNVKYMKVRIPENMCQMEESATDLKAIDFVTIALFGIVLFMMITSTGYDIFCTVHNQKKFQPFIVFSIYTNGKKLFACKTFAPSSSTIQCLDGMRVISLMWIVSIHIYTGYTSLPLHERVPFNEFIKSYGSVVPFTPIAVDTFFAISGLLVSYKMFKLIKKNKKLDILSLYWNRYLRLTPLLGVCVLIVATIYPLLGSGPIWPFIIEEKVDPCKQSWWSVLFYMQNYVSQPHMCITPSWYLCVDMQLYIISPFLVYLVHRFKKSTLIALVASILCSIGYALTVYVNNNLLLFFQQGYFEVYFTTHIRFPSWLIGFITGYILCEFPKGSIHIPKKVNLCAWTLLLIGMPLIVSGNHPYYQLTPTSTALEYGLYDIFSRNIWAIAICYMIFACAHNSGGVINDFLSLPMWQPLSRLSYCIYLIHYHLIGLIVGSMKIPLYFSAISAVQDFISIFVLAIFIAIPLVLAFELPIDAIDKLTADYKHAQRKFSSCTPNKITKIQDSIKIRDFDVKIVE